MPGLQVGFLAKEVHDRAAYLRDTSSLLLGEPHHQGRGSSPLEQAVRNLHNHGRAAEKTRRANTCPLPQHAGETQGINGAHGVPRRVRPQAAPMGRRAPRERICADDLGRRVLPDDEVSGRDRAAGREHRREGQAEGVRQVLHAGGFPLVSERRENRFPDRILLPAQIPRCSVFLRCFFSPSGALACCPLPRESLSVAAPGGRLAGSPPGLC